MGVGASFGLWMKKRRRALDLTQDALAKMVGYSTAMIEKIEADERRPSLQVASLLAKALEIPEFEQAAFLRVARGERIVDHLAGIPFAPQTPPSSELPVAPTPLIGRQPELAAAAKDHLSIKAIQVARERAADISLDSQAVSILCGEFDGISAVKSYSL